MAKFNRDAYKLTARTDSFAGSAIPIDEATAVVMMTHNFPQDVLEVQAFLAPAGPGQGFQPVFASRENVSTR